MEYRFARMFFFWYIPFYYLPLKNQLMRTPLFWILVKIIENKQHDKQTSTITKMTGTKRKQNREKELK